MPLNVDYIALEQALERLKKALGSSTPDRFPELLDEVIAFVGEMEEKVTPGKASKLKVTFEDGHEMWGDWAEHRGGAIGDMKLRMINDDRKRFVEWLKKFHAPVLPLKSEYSFELRFEDEMALGKLLGCFPVQFSNDENGTVELRYDFKEVERWKR